MNKKLNVKFSIIIPAYNCERYILNLIASLKRQSFSDFEAIIVDDGSHDNTYNVIKSSIYNDDRFILISQKNSGPSSARNVAIKKARGDYIAFADSDDIFYDDFLIKINEYVDKYSYDMIVFGYKLKMESINNNDTYRVISMDENIDTIKQEKSVCELYTKLIENNLAFSVWNKVIKRDIIQNNNILFKDYSVAEDRIFVIESVRNSKNILFINECLYSYTLKIEDNQTRKYNEDRYLAMKEFCKILEEYYIDMKFERGNKIVKEILLKAILSCYVAHFDKSCILTEKSKSKNIKSIMYDDYLDKYLSNKIQVSSYCRIIEWVIKTRIIWINKFLGKVVCFIIRNFPGIVNDNK